MRFGEVYALLRKRLREDILSAVLSRTAPGTRLVVAVGICSALFASSALALVILSVITLVLVLLDPVHAERSWGILLFPPLIGTLLFLGQYMAGNPWVAAAISSALVAWKFTLIILAAVVFDVLVPRRHFRYLARTARDPRIWAATAAAVRAVPVGMWAWSAVRKAQKSRSIRLLSVSGADSLVTGFCGHAIEFVYNFVDVLRARGVESEQFTPSEDIARFGAMDVVVLTCVGAMFAFVILK